MSLPQHVCVIGAGLLGGSILALLQPYRVNVRLTAISSRHTIGLLNERGWVDDCADYANLETAVAGADLVLLCSPVAVIFDQLERLSRVASSLAPGAVISDVGSTKEMLCHHGFSLFPASTPEAPRFVGSHPMAGSEKSGLAAADVFLFQSALWVLCPPPDLPDVRLSPLRELIRIAGARSAVLDPAIHDRAVARISHAPQLLSTALAAWTGSSEKLLNTSLSLASTGFRDMTRLAASSWNMWRDVLATNSVNISQALTELSQALAMLAEATRNIGSAVCAADNGVPGNLEKFFYLLAKGDPAQLDALPEGQNLTQAHILLSHEFEAGRALRAKFKAPRKGILHEVSELIVRLEDRPGTIIEVLKPLAAESINVLDMEILKIREGEQGTLLLGFADHETAIRAHDLLTRLDFKVVAR